MANPDHVEQQADGRVRYYWWSEDIAKYIRVVVDRDRLHNRFIDSGAERRIGRKP